MATQNNNHNDYDDDNDTNDCPICLCPLSTPWGICTPCGHAYCRGCWDQLAAASYNHVQRCRGNNNKPSCAVCKTVCKEFVTVFVDLNVASSSVAPAAASREGTTVAAHDMSTLQQLDNDTNDENDDEEKLDQLTKEWDSLWRELEMLHPEIIPSDSSSNCDENNDEEDENNSLIWDNGQREVAAICANFIDLTQDNTHDNDDDNNDGASQVPIPSRKTSRKQQKEKAAPSLQGQEALQQKEQRTHTILRRLKQLHREIMQFQHDNIARQSSSSSSPSSSSFTNMTTQQTQKLRSKLIKLQSSNADLTSQLQSHQLEIDTLNTRIDSYQKSLTERTVETEKEKRKAETIAQEFHLMEQSYEKHISKTSLEHNALKSDIRRLQDQVKKLTSQSGLQDLQEMEEIRRKYSKMSQDVHLLRSENARLTKRLEDERMRAASKAKFNKMMTEMMNKSDVADVGKDSVVAHSSSSRHDKSIKSRKVSLDGRGRDQQAFPPKKMPSVAAAAAATTTTSSSFSFKTPFSPPKSKDNPSKKSKAMDILDNTRSRKHSLQQNSLLMSVKRTKTTSFAKEKAPRKSNVSAEVAAQASSSGIPHPFFGRKRSEG
jgi:regulator of replication initiation timing